MSEEEIIKVLNCEDIFDTANEGVLELLNEENDYDLNILKQQAIQGLLDLYNKEEAKNKKFKKALIDMVNQFAYEDNNPKTKGSSLEKLYTGGLSALEDAFDVLDIDEGIKREDLWKLQDLLEEDNK